jgi:hypothetical protein
MSKNDLKIFNLLVLCIILLGLASAVQNVKFLPIIFKKKEVPPPPPPERLTYIPQFVLISFDGGRDNKLWNDLRVFREEMKSVGKRINYTYFFNTAYLLTPETHNFYVGPNGSGQTNIGNASNVEDIRLRLMEMNKAIAAGDEIAPHTTGHFSGRYWTKDEWRNELDSFDAILFGVDKLYPDANLPKLNLKPEDVIGFRAPYLDKSPGLYEMLHENPRYKYDTSEIAEGDAWPTRDAQGLWHIPLGTLYVGQYKSPVLAMDYNLYVRDSQAQDWFTKDSEAWTKMHDEQLTAWLEYFNRNYTKNRAPVLMGYHYGQWNDGVYWSVMKDFAREVCGKPEVVCGTFKDLIKYLEEYGVPKTI